MRVKNALLSVWDKTGIVELARSLVLSGVRIISTGGTREVLAAAGVAVTDISEITGNPEAFGGRMKTISFQIGSGILFDRDRDEKEALALKTVPIDLVVANLYPFAEYKEKKLELERLIEYIDIGGPMMIRAAAKNFAHVAVLTNPADYSAFTQELTEAFGAVSLATRRRLMQVAFETTAKYDMTIAEHLASVPLRYGENPHQNAVFVPDPHGATFEILGGKPLSYNNLIDLDAALAASHGLTGVGCAIVKHENPCGLAVGDSNAHALAAAWAGDPVSAFGGVISFNSPVTKACLGFLEMDEKETRKFVEIVAAPEFTEDAVTYLAQNKNLRILRTRAAAHAQGQIRRTLSTGTLLQSPDTLLFEKLEVVSKSSTDSPQIKDEALIAFGLHAVRCLKSNAIAIVHRTASGALALLGMGAGQPNRVKSTELAIAQAAQNLARVSDSLNAAETAVDVRNALAQTILTSDAFFPFADAVELALAAGIRVIVEPGGSLRDPEVIAACDAHGAQLIFTGTRHFKH